MDGKPITGEKSLRFPPLNFLWRSVDSASSESQSASIRIIMRGSNSSTELTISMELSSEIRKNLF